MSYTIEPPDSSAPTKADGLKLVTLKTKSGATFQVNERYAKNFQGFVDDLESRGYKVRSVGGYNDRDIAGSNRPSYHALGDAIDINPGENPVSHDGVAHDDLPSDVAKLAKAHGLGWGGDWSGKKRDPMHFSVAVDEGGTSQPEGTPAPTKTAASAYTIEPPDAPPKPKAAPPKKPGLGAQLADTFADIPREMGRQTTEAEQQFGKDLRLGDPRGVSPMLPVDALNVVGAPISGAATTILGKPISNALKMATGGRVDISPRETGNVAAMALGGAGEVSEAGEVARASEAAGVSREALAANRTARAAAPKPANTLKATSLPSKTDTSHAASVARLEAEGVHPAWHQLQGGRVQRIAESQKANPYAGQGVRQAEEAANDSFNRGFYRKIMKPLGLGVKDNIPVGREGVAAVGKKLDEAYSEALPHIKLNADPALTDELAAVRTSVAKLGKPQEQQFEAILNQDVLHHFGPQVMDGRTFKSVESDLLRQSRALKGSPDPNARGLGYALDDTLDALRADMERSSPPEWRDRLRGINQSYAMFTRLQDAAARRQGSGGVITPGDLLAAVKKGDRTVRKGAFARGDALLQDFAEDADRVLSPRHGTSFTPEITASNRLLSGHGAIASVLGGTAGLAAHGPEGAMAGAALGAGLDMGAAKVTNTLARAMLTRSAKTARPQNYLGAVERRALARRAPLLAAPSAGQPQQ